MKKLPTETLIHIFSYLDARDLKTVPVVCRRWHSVMNEDSSWRYAFEHYFGGLPFHRLNEGSWRNEYLQRIYMTREWSRGKKIFAFDPHVGNIDRLFVDIPNDCLYVASLSKGVIAKCNPHTGKVHKDLIYTNRDMFMNPITAIHMERHRIVAGFPSGDLVMITNIVRDKEPLIQNLSGMHDGPVTVIRMIKDHSSKDPWLLSCGWDGCLQVYDLQRLTRVLRISPSTSSAAGCIQTMSSGKNNVVILGTDKGKLLFYKVPSAELLPNNGVAHYDNVFDLDTNESSAVIKVHYLQSLDLVFVLLDNSKVVQCRSYPSGELMFELPAKVSVKTFFVYDAYLDEEQISSSNTARDLVVAIGDASGCLRLFQIPTSSLSKGAQNPLNGNPTPRLIIHKHISSITNIKVDAFKLVSAAMDGEVLVFSAVDGNLIKSLKVKAVKTNPALGNAGNQETVPRFSVPSHEFHVEEFHIFLASKDSIKCFHFQTHQPVSRSKRRGPAPRLSLSRGLTPGGSSRSGGLNSPSSISPSPLYTHSRFAFEREIRNQKEETEFEMFQEKMAQEKDRKKHIKYNGVDIVSPGGRQLTEEELIQYALTVSRQDSGLEPHDPRLITAIQKSLEIPTTRGRSSQSLTSPSFTESISSSFGHRGQRKRYEKWEKEKAYERELDGESQEDDDDFYSSGYHLHSSRAGSHSHVTVKPREQDEDWELDYALQLSLQEN